MAEQLQLPESNDLLENLVYIARVHFPIIAMFCGILAFYLVYSLIDFGREAAKTIREQNLNYYWDGFLFYFFLLVIVLSYNIFIIFYYIKNTNNYHNLLLAADRILSYFKKKKHEPTVPLRKRRHGRGDWLYSIDIEKQRASFATIVALRSYLFNAGLIILCITSYHLSMYIFYKGMEHELQNYSKTIYVNTFSFIAFGAIGILIIEMYIGKADIEKFAEIERTMRMNPLYSIYSFIPRK